METESGTGTGTGVGRESRIVKRNPICEMERETERNPKRETERETERDPKRETERETKQETKRNPKRETELEGDKAPNLTNGWYLKNTGCCMPIYSPGVRWPLYTQDRLTTPISIPVRRPPDLYIVLVHFHAIPNQYLRNRASPAA